MIFWIRDAPYPLDPDFFNDKPTDQRWVNIELRDVTGNWWRYNDTMSGRLNLLNLHPESIEDFGANLVELD